MSVSHHFGTSVNNMGLFKNRYAMYSRYALSQTHLSTKFPYFWWLNHLKNMATSSFSMLNDGLMMITMLQWWLNPPNSIKTPPEMMLQSPKHNAYHFQSNQRNSALLRWPLHRSATVARSGHRRRLHPGQLDGSLMGAARLGGSRVFKKQIMIMVL